MKKMILFVVTTLITVGASARVGDFDYLYKNLPFKMERLIVPTFPDNRVSVVDFGGVGDAVTLNTEAFAKAIDALGKIGGGTLEVPFGVWYTGPITLQSNINLHLKEGALIVFSANFDDYRMIETSFEGLETRRCISPLNAEGAVNIAITGRGAIDGNGMAWRPVKKSKMTEGEWKDLVRSGGVVNKSGDTWFPSEKSMRGYDLATGNFNVPRVRTDAEWESVKDFLRPVMVSFSRCKGIYLEGVTFQNSPSWNIHPNMCENLILDGVTVRNPWYAQNGDGIDVESCTNVIIVNSSFDVGDDGICIKSGKDAEGRRRGMPCQNIIVDNCTVFHGHGGFVVGSEMSGGARNISVTNCMFLGTDVGLRFKSNRGRGGVVENIYIENCSMVDIATEPLLFDLFYGGKSASEQLADGDVKGHTGTIPPVTEETPAFRNIFIKNISCRNARRAMFFNGLPEMNIQNVVVENAGIESELGAELSEADGVILRNVRISQRKGDTFILNNVRNLKAEEVSSPAPITVAVAGENSRDISINSQQNEIETRMPATFKAEGRNISITGKNAAATAVKGGRSAKR